MINKCRQRLRWVILCGYVRQKTFNIDENSVATWRSENRNTVFEPAPQIVYLFHAAGHVGITGKNLLQRDSYRFHRCAGRLTAIEKILHRSVLIAGFVAHGNDATRGYEKVFERAHRAAVSQAAGFINDLLERAVLIARLALFDQITI